MSMNPHQDLLEDFIIEEPIGNGKHSTIYKARRRKTFQYHAVKIVEKKATERVLRELGIIDGLYHYNLRRFYSRYESKDHILLIWEYSVGGNLLTLIQQDGGLSNDTLYNLAVDLVRGLQYLHSKGIIYCDLKLSNILLNGIGPAKLCDFSLAKKLSDVSTTPSVEVVRARSGSYVAPELFQVGGVHSYASDFWALGCVLYACYTGRPPFADDTHDDTPALPGTLPVVNLINSLLLKDPAKRIQWPELRSHSFWRSKINPTELPPQPDFTKMIELFAELRLTKKKESVSWVESWIYTK